MDDGIIKGRMKIHGESTVMGSLIHGLSLYCLLELVVALPIFSSNHQRPINEISSSASPIPSDKINRGFTCFDSNLTASDCWFQLPKVGNFRLVNVLDSDHTSHVLCLFSVCCMFIRYVSLPKKGMSENLVYP